MKTSPRTIKLICTKCRRPMKGSTAYDGACECGGLITSFPPRFERASGRRSSRYKGRQALVVR